MSTVRCLGVVVGMTLACATSACVERHPPWKLYRRPPCADVEERVERDRARVEEIEQTGRRRDALEWYQDDLRKARHELERCKRAEPKS